MTEKTPEQIQQEVNAFYTDLFNSVDYSNPTLHKEENIKIAKKAVDDYLAENKYSIDGNWSNKIAIADEKGIAIYIDHKLADPKKFLTQVLSDKGLIKSEQTDLQIIRKEVEELKKGIVKPASKAQLRAKQLAEEALRDARNPNKLDESEGAWITQQEVDRMETARIQAREAHNKAAVRLQHNSPLDRI